MVEMSLIGSCLSNGSICVGLGHHVPKSGETCEEEVDEEPQPPSSRVHGYSSVIDGQELASAQENRELEGDVESRP